MVDFDGTISEIAPTPQEAVVSPKAAESLKALASRLELVSVISGRPAHDVRDKVGVGGLVYVGNHGAEYLDGGRLSHAPGLSEYREALEAVFDHLRSTVDAAGLLWEDKHFGLSVHYRMAGDPVQARKMLADALASAPGAGKLDILWGKMVVEVRPASGVDKGYAVRRLVREHRLESVIVVGDDTTDLAAFAALVELRRQGDLQGAAVAVLHPDSPEQLARSADYSLRGVPEVEVFLRRLSKARR
jgi:trehalose 6-phosphate phosphatase